MKLYVEYTPYNEKRLEQVVPKEITFQHFGPYYGSLEGPEYIIQKVLPKLEANFGIMFLNKEQFVGKLALMFNEYSGSEDAEDPAYVAPEDRPNLDSYLTRLGLVGFDSLSCAKEYKKVELKRALRTLMGETPDMTADITKLFMLKSVYYDAASTVEKVQIDNLINRLKTVYDMTSCLTSVGELCNSLETVVANYYTKKALLGSTNDKASIENLTLEG